ncbi:MAG: hypothetical protein H6Q90_1593 [Deltaproteobacteria bacterium]|nr:hypothetical protein [Deltaproteobacteria bacterium]
MALRPIDPPVWGRWLAVVVLAGCGRGDSIAVPAPVITPGDAPGDARTVGAPEPCPVERPSLGPGLTVDRWAIAGIRAAGASPCLDVVRADLARFRLVALSADGKGKPATAWRDDAGLAAVTNAGMFHDGGAPVGLVVSGGNVRGIDNPKFSGFFAWDPVSPGDPPVVVGGRGCPGFDLATLRRRYRSLVQSYRLLDCDGHALAWQDPKHYSAAGIGVDRAGRVVFLHARAAFTMAELATTLASHDLTGAVFLEGGPEASLVARGPEGALSLVGSYETGFVENDDNHEPWALPNVIGLVAR